MVLPSSHCSLVSFTPSPQAAHMHRRRHASGRLSEFFTPSSQISPNAGSTTLSPQCGMRHLLLQLSALVSEFNGPSSHSSPISRTPLPQMEIWHVGVQPLPSRLLLPLSHCSSL